MRTDDVTAVAQSAYDVPTHRSLARRQDCALCEMTDISFVALNEIGIDKQRGIDSIVFQNRTNHIGAVCKSVVERERHQRSVGIMPGGNHPRRIFESDKFYRLRKLLQHPSKRFGMSLLSLTTGYHMPVEYVNARRRFRHRTKHIQHASANYIS